MDIDIQVYGLTRDEMHLEEGWVEAIGEYKKKVVGITPSTLELMIRELRNDYPLLIQYAPNPTPAQRTAPDYVRERREFEAEVALITQAASMLFAKLVDEWIYGLDEDPQMLWEGCFYTATVWARG